jgi:hypothetical protein
MQEIEGSSHRKISTKRGGMSSKTFTTKNLARCMHVELDKKNIKRI